MASGDVGDAFTSFIDARQNAGRPVTLAFPYPRPRYSGVVILSPLATTSGSSEAGVTSIHELGSHMQASVPFVQATHYYPHPSSPASFLPYCTHGLLDDSEDFVR
jgi:hypothetical protein